MLQKKTSKTYPQEFLVESKTAHMSVPTICETIDQSQRTDFSVFVGKRTWPIEMQKQKLHSICCRHVDINYKELERRAVAKSEGEMFGRLISVISRN